MVCLMVLPAVLDGAPPRRLAARKSSRPPGRVHHTLACGPAVARTRVLRAKGSTRTHNLLKVPKIPTAANFLERLFYAVRCIALCGLAGSAYLGPATILKARGSSIATKREIRPARPRCVDNDHRFTAQVRQVGHYVAESPQPVKWVVETTEGITCPYCGSRVEPVQG